MKRRYPPSLIFPSVLWFLLFWSAVVYIRHLIHDPDVWWHLAAGRHLVETGEFLRKDIFSHTLAGTTWINFEWLGQVLLYSVFNAGGINGVYWGKVLLGVLSMVLLLASAWAGGARGVLLFLLVWLGFNAAKVRLCARIEIFSLVFFPAFVFLILCAESLLKKYRTPIALVLSLLMVLWVNIHGGFVYGLGVLVLFALGAVWSKKEKSFQRWLLSTTGIVFLMTFINSWGPKIYLIFWEVLVNFKTYPGYLAEWEFPLLSTTPYFWGTFFLAGLVLIWGFYKNSAKTFFWAPTIIFFAIFCSSYIRSTALFAFVVIPFFAAMFSELKLFKAPRPLALWLVCLLPLSLNASHLTKTLPPWKVDWLSLPTGSCQFVKQHNIRGTMFNAYGYGGYIIWALGPERKVFMDGRYIFHKTMAEEQNLELGRLGPIRPQAWQVYFDRYGVDFALMNYPRLRYHPRSNDEAPPNLLNMMFPSSHWALVFWDDSSLVFLKRNKKFDPLIQKLEYRYLTPYNFEQMEVGMRTKTLNFEAVLEEYKRHLGAYGPTARGARIETLLRDYIKRKEIQSFS